MAAICHRFKHTVTLFAFVQRLPPFLTRGNSSSRSLIPTAIQLGRVTPNGGGHTCVKELQAFAQSWTGFLN